MNLYRIDSPESAKLPGEFFGDSPKPHLEIFESKPKGR